MSLMYDAIIVGAGPAGAAAAMGLKGKRVLMLDVGCVPDKKSAEFSDNFYNYKGAGDHSSELLLGENLESLHNVSRPYLMPKLKAPFQRYVTDSRQELGRVHSEAFNAKVSYAKGGLANAWGAQLLRYDDADLNAFPIGASDLQPHYEELEREIGVSGANDDMAKVYGVSDGMQPPLRKSRLGAKILSRYRRARAGFERDGFVMGEPRLGVNSRPHNGRKGAAYKNLEFFKPNIEANYSPAYTIDRLVGEGALDYRAGYYAEETADCEGGAYVVARNLAEGRMERFTAQKVVLCAGAINSAKLALKSRRDTATRLPIMDNGLSLIPLLELTSIGAATEVESFYNQLCLGYEAGHGAERVIGTFYALTGILSSELMFDLPVSTAAMPAVARNLFPAMLVLHLWYPEEPNKDNWMALAGDNDVQIQYKVSSAQHIEKLVIGKLRRLGLLTHQKLVQYPESGSSFHYAGTLPMKSENVGPYETGMDGRLGSSENIHVADGAVFPVLPAKNLSLTIMANALRVSRLLRADL